MSASITFTDAEGTVVLTNDKPGHGGRFTAWTPSTAGIEADDEETLGGGVRHVWEFGARRDATLTLRHIPNTRQPQLVRLARHLRRGDPVSITTGDIAARVYPTCQHVKGTPIDLRQPDRAELEWDLTVTVRNVAGGSAPDLLCVY